MLKKLVVPIVLFILMVAACSPNPAPTQIPAPDESPTELINPAQTETLPTQPVEQPSEQPPATSQPEEYPPPISLPVIGVGAYPEPSEEVGSGIVPPGEGEDDQNSGGGLLVKGELFIDNVELKINPGELPQVDLIITGNLPSPCHQFAASIGQPDPDGKIEVDAYSLVDPDAVCSQMLQPIEETVNLGNFPSGSYTILVNGEVIQELEF